MALVTVKTTDVASLVNAATASILGESAVLTEDLSNVIDVGIALANANAYKTFVDNLLMRIGKTVFVSRVYTGGAPKIYRDSFEYGQITQKLRAKLDEAKINQSWALVSGTTYSDNEFVQSQISCKIFKQDDAFEIRKSITKDQIKAAFTSASELGNFISMLETMVQNSIQVKMDSLTMMTINNFTAEVMNNETAKPNTSINLLKAYNALKSTTLTAEQCIYDRGFLQYATGVIKKYQKKIQKYSTLFNQTATQTFTPKEKQHLVLLEEFSENCDTYLAADTWHDEFVKLPYSDTVSAWQGTGKDNSFSSCSSINVSTASGSKVAKTGIIGVLFDHDALGITKDEPTIEVNYIHSGQFYNYWYKEHVMYFNDLDENFIVFYVA